MPESHTITIIRYLVSTVCVSRCGYVDIHVRKHRHVLTFSRSHVLTFSRPHGLALSLLRFFNDRHSSHLIKRGQICSQCYHQKAQPALPCSQTHVPTTLSESTHTTCGYNSLYRVHAPMHTNMHIDIIDTCALSSILACLPIRPDRPKPDSRSSSQGP